MATKQHDNHPLSTGCARFLNPKGWKCSMVWAATMGLPLSLKGVGAVLKLEDQKMDEGKALIKYFSVPCCKRSGAIQFVRLVAACSICAVNCVTTLCRISGDSALAALPGRGAATQFVTNGGWGAANLFGDGSV